MTDRQKYPRVKTPYDYYDDALRYFRRPAQYERSLLLSKRLRMTIRLIALEEVCQELDVGAIPPTVMSTLRLLCDFKEMHGKHGNRGLKFYKPSGRSRRMVDLRAKRMAWKLEEERLKAEQAAAQAEDQTNGNHDS